MASDDGSSLQSNSAQTDGAAPTGEAAPRRSLRRTRHDERVHDALDRYWRSNLRVMAVLLVVWAFVSFGCGILWADWLNRFNLPFTGFPLGFWFAQQGSVATFVVCILVYCLAMNRLDKQHHEELESIERGG